eukprot:SAG11_NODE_636_length_8034_cov_5.199118_11_plen_73_part_00
MHLNTPSTDHAFKSRAQVEVKKKVARYLATHALDTLGKILETHQGSAPMLRTFLALVGKIALLPDIKEAMSE